MNTVSVHRGQNGITRSQSGGGGDLGTMGNETLRPLGFGPCFGRKLQAKKRMMNSPGGPYIVVTPIVTSWVVAGQQVAFLHMYLQTQVTPKAFPVATPRGRSSKFPWRGTPTIVVKIKVN